MKNILVVGSLNMDMIFKLDRIPNEGETLHASAFSTLPGGKGANQAVTCASFGVGSYMIGSVGNDSFGEIIKKNMISHHVNIDYLQVDDDENTGVACIMINHGDNRIIVNEGANLKTTSNQAIQAINHFHADDAIFLTQLEVPLLTVIDSIQYAKERRFYTILNPAPAKNMPSEIYPMIDLLIPNEVEAQMMTGYDIEDSHFDQKVIDYFISRGVQEVIMTKGHQGAVYGNKDEIIHVSPFNIEVVDTTGAGDTFVGAIASEIAKGKTVKESLVFASAASALSVSKFGAQQAIPNTLEVLEFLNRKLGD